MEERMKGKRSKYSSKQKEVIKERLSPAKVRTYNLQVEEVSEMPFSKILLPEKGFEPLYSNISRGGESFHLPANNDAPYFFSLSKADAIMILPECETDVEARLIMEDVLEIRFIFLQRDGSIYLSIPFIFFLKSEEIGGLVHRWELRNLLDFSAFDINLIAFFDDKLLHYVGNAPVRFYEYKKEQIYDALSKYLGIFHFSSE
jgi:hypothetical protein